MRTIMHRIFSIVIFSFISFNACDSQYQTQRSGSTACRLETTLPGYVSPDSQIQVTPLVSEIELDSIGLYAGWLHLEKGLKIEAHRHSDAAEFLFFTCGKGILTIGDSTIDVRKDVAVMIPAGVTHGFISGKHGVVAVQLYRPGDPGQRFYDFNEVKRRK